MNITVQPACEDDAAAIVDLESRPQFAEYILRWDIPRQQDGIRDPHKRYFVTYGPDRSLTAFAIVAGIRSPHRNIELVRVLCADPGRGVGRTVFRNVSSYVNAFRVEEVRRRLLDTRQDEVPILTMALEAGFGSIVAFNRAFKDSFGVTPLGVPCGSRCAAGQRNRLIA